MSISKVINCFSVCHLCTIRWRRIRVVQPSRQYRRPLDYAKETCPLITGYVILSPPHLFILLVLYLYFFWSFWLPFSCFFFNIRLVDSKGLLDKDWPEGGNKKDLWKTGPSPSDEASHSTIPKGDSVVGVVRKDADLFTLGSRTQRPVLYRDDSENIDDHKKWSRKKTNLSGEIADRRRKKRQKDWRSTRQQSRIQS